MDSDNLQKEILALRATITALTQENRTSESLRVMHARTQGAADGFQQGWHAALQRMSEGDSIELLTDLVPDFKLQDKLAELSAHGTALAAENQQLQEIAAILREYVQHRSSCPQFMAIRFKPEPGWVVGSQSKPCNCGLTEKLAKALALRAEAPKTEGAAPPLRADIQENER